MYKEDKLKVLGYKSDGGIILTNYHQKGYSEKDLIVKTDTNSYNWNVVIRVPESKEGKVKRLYREVYHGVLDDEKDIREYEKMVTFMNTEELDMALEILETILECRPDVPDTEKHRFFDVSFMTDDTVIDICKKISGIFTV